MTCIIKEGFVLEPFENVNVYSRMCHLLGIEPASNNGSLQAVQHLLKEHKHDYTVLIVVSVISVLVLLLMSYGIVSFCVKNHCRIRQYRHILGLHVTSPKIKLRYYRFFLVSAFTKNYNNKTPLHKQI